MDQNTHVNSQLTAMFLAVEEKAIEAATLYPYPNRIAAIKHLRTEWPTISLRHAVLLIDGAHIRCYSR